MIDPERLLERFLRYVQVDTTAVEGAESYPSSAGQRDLGAMIVRELRDAGIEDASQDEHGIVMATVPSSAGATDVPVIALNAHLDTSPETTGAGVQPQVWRGYDGGDLQLPGDPSKVISFQNNPELHSVVGCTLVTTDGTTLLGGDDKAGIAVIMELVSCLAEHPESYHGAVRLLFTCDEEIGRGVDFVDLKKLGASAGYTLDGPAAGQVDVETFSADLAVVLIRGVNIHPAIAQHRMVNAVRAAAYFLDQLPRTSMSPETTAGRDGFLHPYKIEGGVDSVKMRILLRDFDTNQLDRQAALLKSAAEKVEQEFAGSRVEVSVTPQYRNLRDGLARDPRPVQYVEQAYGRLGRTVKHTIIRGGTDGSLLTQRGLPTPNLSTGQHTPHSPLEWVCLEEMVRAVEVLVELVQVWAEEQD
jgi:tripeptide aminopeptidase